MSASLASIQLASPQLVSFLLEQNSDAVITLDPASNIVGWNPSAEKLYGYSRLQILHQSVNVLFPPELPGELLIRSKNLRSAQPVINWETQQVSKDGSEIPLCVSLSPQFDKAGRLNARCMIARERVRTDGLPSQVRNMQKLEAVGRLAGGIAHDFNNLLTVISGYNSLLLSSLPPQSPLIGYATEVQRAADCAATLTGQLLTFGRRAVTVPEVLNLNFAAQDLEKMLKRIIGKNITIDLDLSPKLENIKADPGQISQMLMNLAINARDAMPEGGLLRIATSNVQMTPPSEGSTLTWAKGPYVQIEVSDTGSGMDEHTREHLFEPFFTTKVIGRGTGLGLSIVYGIVSRMGGRISVTSQPGKGSCFTLSFPVTFESNKESGTSMEAVSESKNPATGSSILLVEDEDGIRLLVKEMLLKLGYLVHDTAVPEEAVEMNDKRQYDLLLTDIVMPTIGGGELATRLRQSRPVLQVLYMSGYVDESMFPEGFLRPGDNFILKPFTADQLAKQVKYAVQLSQAIAVCNPVVD